MSSLTGDFGLIPHQNLDNTGDRPLDVNVVNIVFGDNGVIRFESVSAIAAGVDATVLLYTVPPGKSFKFMSAGATGTSDSVYKFIVDGTAKDEFRTNWTERNAKFDLKDIKFTAGTVIKITARHSELTIQDFSARLVGVEE